jgi:uncharacterized membrane protein (DUF4010 family)
MIFLMRNALKSLTLHDVLFFIGLIFLYYILPDNPINEWVNISFKKITFIILILTLFQFIGLVLINLVSSHTGAILHGLISGMISSTALTVLVSKNSQKYSEEHTSVESLSLLSGIIAMLVQAIFFIYIAAPHINPIILSLGISQILVTIFLLFKRVNHTKERTITPILSINWKSSFKLALFIVFILTLSFNGKKILGDQTLYILTFIVSLFELHGSVIATSQLYASQSIDLIMLNNLLALAFISSHISKIFIVFALGSNYLKKKIISWSVLSITVILIAQVINYLILSIK